MKKNWASMTFEERVMNIAQCIEAGYTIGEKKGDCIEALRSGYENDPEWFCFGIEEDDWDSVFEFFAEKLADGIAFEFDDFERYVGTSETECAKNYMLQWHKEGIRFNEEDLQFVMEDLYRQHKSEILA